MQAATAAEPATETNLFQLPGLPHGHAKCEVPAERRLQIARKTARPLAVAEFEKFLSVANQALRENGPDLAQATLSGVEDNQTNRPNENPTKHKTSSKDQLC
jgi:hypothetical protein